MGRYEKKIAEFEKAGKLDEMYEYMAACVPYLEKFSGGGGVALKRKDIFHEYLRNVENYTGPIDDEVTCKISETAEFECEMCTSLDTFEDSESQRVCRACGHTSFLLGEELNYEQEQEVKFEKNTVVYTYKRANHFNELLLQFQGQENTVIPKEIIELLKEEFKKQRISNMSNISHQKVRNLLKKLNLTKYYEHVPYIANILSCEKPPNMPQALEDRLRHMFDKIQVPFDRHCPPDRKNFLSYSYVLYKFCELLGDDQYLPYFPLLKSIDKLRKQDIIWQKICHDLRWEFIPTV